MPGLSWKTVLYGAAGGLGGSGAWAFIIALSGSVRSGLVTEILLGAVAGIFIGAFIWSHEAITGRQFRTALKRAAYGGTAGLFGGLTGAGLGNTLFSLLGNYAADLGGSKAAFGTTLSVALGWAVLGAAVGMSGGVMISSRDRTFYGLAGGAIGGFLGGAVLNTLSATSIWSTLVGLSLLGAFVGTFISLVEEAFVSAKMKVIKGRHTGREFPLVKELSVIGRDDRSDVCLSGAEGVGMQHALIKRNNGNYVIETDRPGKVVYVNHKLIKSGRLSDGDVIRVGSVIMMFTAVRRAVAAATLIVLPLLLPGLPEANAQETLRAQITQFDLSTYPEIRAYVSILDRNGRPAPGLDARAVAVKENGRSVRFAEMEPASGQGKREPLAVALLLDRSGSMAGNKMAQAKESVQRFISLMGKEDRASLLAFDDAVSELVPLTDMTGKLRLSLVAVRPGGHTALYDAILRGVDSVKTVAGRRAVIVLTDGKANRGVSGIDQAIEYSTRAYVSVYVIGLGEDARTARLDRIARETGGSYFFTPSAEGLAAIYETISRRIRNEYVITYETERRGEYLRTVTLDLRDGTGTERTYFQPESSLFGSGNRLPAWAFLVPVMSMAGLVALSFKKLERSHTAGHLSIVRGKGTKKEIDVNASVTLGRNERNTIGLFKDEGIAQQHAEVIQENRGYVIEDKGSATGTFVNRKRITGRQVLKDGDIIDMGQTTIVFSAGDRRECSGCGESIRTGAKFCPKCGMKAG